MTAPPHPQQPLVRDDHGVVRFKENRLVSAFLDAARQGRKLDLNDVAAMDFSAEDRRQLAQLVGYSLAGYHELSYVSDEAALAASTAAREQLGDPAVGGCRGHGCEIHRDGGD